MPTERELHDAKLIFQLARIGAVETVGQILESHRPTRSIEEIQVGNLTLSEFMQLDVSEFRIDTQSLEENAEAVVDQIFDEVDDLLAKDKGWDAMGMFKTGLEYIGNVFKDRGFSLDQLALKMEKKKKQAGEIARQVGASGFTIEFGITSIFSIAFHFQIEKVTSQA